MQRVTKRNIILAILLVLILIVIALLIGNFTYSFIAPDIDDDITNQGEVTASGDTIIFSSGNALSLHATTDNFNATSSNLTDTTNPSVRLIASNKTNNASTTYYAGVIINENTFTYSTDNNTAELILTILDENGNPVQTSSDTLSYVTVNGVSGFDITGKTGAFNIVTEHPISTTSSTTGTTHTWTFTLTFVNLDTDQSVNENATLDMEVVLQRDLIEDITLLSDYIKNEVYTGVDGENGIYYHDGVGDYENASEEAGDNSYRYAGANPNNYVCFASDEATCPVDNLYRIIGVFDDQVKLIKSTSYGSYYWGSNNWQTSTLKNTLNSTYLNSLGEWSNLIEANTTWYLGGASTNQATPKQFYGYERGTTVYSGRPTSDITAIGLMYPSDYGYAASPDYWVTRLIFYDSATSANWLYLGSGERTITPYSSLSYYVFNVSINGYLNSHGASYGYAVRPVFYLKSNVALVDGVGSSGDPYRVAIA